MAGERRKNQRLNLVRDMVVAASITSSAPDFVMAAKVTNIGVGGLALTHHSCKLPQYTSLELGIVLPGETVKIRNLTGESIWDQDTQSQVPARRCGMRFRNLTDDQKASLQYLIRNYTTKGEEP
jgi:hypothetical protein